MKFELFKNITVAKFVQFFRNSSYKMCLNCIFIVIKISSTLYLFMVAIFILLLSWI